MSYYDDYSRQLSRVNAMRMMLAAQNKTVAQPGPQDIALDVLRRMKAPVFSPPSTPAPKPKGPGGILGTLGKVMPFVAPGTWALMKGADTSPGRAIMDVLSRPTYAVAQYSSEYNKEQERALANYERDNSYGGANEVVSWLRPLVSGRPYSGFKQGITGEVRKTNSDVVREQNPGVGNKTAALWGLALDVTGDPLNLIPTGPAVSAGRVALRGAKARAAIRPVEAVAKTAQETGTVAESQVPIVEKILSSTKPAVQGIKLPPVTPVVSPEEIVASAEAQQIMGQIKSAPRYSRPDLDIPPPFKEIDEPVASANNLTAPAQKTEEQQARLARARAVKATILQNEDYRIGKYSVGSILNAARKATDPTRRKLAEKVIDDEVKRIVKSGDYEGLPGRAQLFGASGEKAAFGLDLDQFTNLIHKGEIGGDLGKYGNETDEFTKRFPVHSVDDLENVYLNNARGERVTLGKYLGDLGVQVKQVTPDGGIKFRKTPKRTLDLPLPNKAVPAGAQKKTVRISAAEGVEWVSKLKGQLTPSEIKYLAAAKTVAEFNKRVDNLKATTVAGDFKTLEDFIDAANKGAIPKEAVDQILQNVGVKSLQELKNKAESIFKKVGEAKAPKQIPAELSAAQVNAPVPHVPLPPKEAPKLDSEQLQDLAAALPEGVIKNLVDPQDLEKFPFITNVKKSKRTSATPGTGRARNLHGWNGLSQSDVFRSIAGAAAKRHVVPKGLKGKEAFKAWKDRSAAMYDEVIPTLQAAEWALAKEGVKVISGTDNRGLMLSLSDVLLSLPRPLVERHLFNPRTSVLPTEFLEAADSLVRARMGQADLTTAREFAKTVFQDSPRIKTLPKGEAVASQLSNALVGNLDEIVQRVERNYQEHALEVGTAVKSMSDDVINNVVQKYANPDVSVGEAFGDFVMRHEDISKIGKKENAPTEAYSAAKDAADASLATVLKPGDFAEAKSAKEMAGVTTEAEAAKVGVRQTASRTQEAVELIDETEDLGDIYQAGLHGSLFRANVPLLDKVYTMKDALGRAFVADYGHGQLHTALRVERSVVQDFSRKHRALIAQLHDSLNEAYGPGAKQAAQEAFRHLQHGTKTADPAMEAAMRGLQSSLDLTFGSSVDNIGGFAQRNGIFAKHLNEIMDYYGAPKALRFDEAKPFIEQASSWREWDNVDDPLALLDIMHASMQRATVEVTLGRDFSHQFGRAASAPGYVKITNKGGKSKIGRFLDQDLYYPKEIVSQLRMLDDVLRGSLAGIQNPTAAALVKKYDDIIHGWKAGLTIYRPGHHVRNLVGDVTLAFFDGVVNPAVYTKATRILARRSKAYDGWDGLKALEEGHELIGASDAGATYIKVAGKKVKLTDDQVWRAAFDQGIIPDFRTLEDIAYNTAQSLQFKAGKGISITRPLGGRGQRVAGGVSQARDHMVRIAHFLDVVQKGNFKSLDDAFNAAGARVRKWHPDGSDLTNFEKKVMRRSFMFYSWMRKAIPLVAETLMMRPGRALVFPKAMYAFAEMNGVDLDSLDNPFPLDQLFPEFITDQVTGPQMGEAGNYTGINPGEPVTELMSQWGSSDPQHSVLGALTPAARVPIELATNKNLGTGSEIMDKTDYADSQVPGLGNLARITGHSPMSGFTQETKDVQRGNTEPGFNSRALINDLLGLGVRDYSKPSYIRRAQMELRNKIGEELRNG